MKHLMRYEGFSPQDRQDEILDKINKYGIKSLNVDEIEFLDSYSNGDQENIHKKLQLHENETTFEDDQGYFKFELKSIREFKNKKYYVGTIYVPDLKLENGKKVEGRLEGKIVNYGDGRTIPEFFSRNKKHDIFEFCEGLEYELDSFVDYVIMESEKDNFKI